VNPEGGAPAGTPITVRFRVTAAGGAPTGTVTVASTSEYSSCEADVAVGRCTLTLWAWVTHELIATYTGDASFARSADTAYYDVWFSGVAEQAKRTPARP
jgi:hypothetical protein